MFAVALRPDGAQLASASFDQTVRLWDLGQGRPAGVFRGHSDFVYAVAYTPDGRHLLTAGKDRTIKRINVRTLKEERTYSGHDHEVLAVAVHPDGKRFVSAGNEPQIRWWALDGEKPTARRGGHAGPVHQLAFSGDGRRLISAGGDRSVRLWDGRPACRSASSPGRPSGSTRPRSPTTAACRRRGLGRPGPPLGRRLRPPPAVTGPAAQIGPPQATDIDDEPRAPTGSPSVPSGYRRRLAGLIEAAELAGRRCHLPAEAARAACVPARIGRPRACAVNRVTAVSFPTQ